MWTDRGAEHVFSPGFTGATREICAASNTTLLFTSRHLLESESEQDKRLKKLIWEPLKTDQSFVNLCWERSQKSEPGGRCIRGIDKCSEPPGLGQAGRVGCTFGAEEAEAEPYRRFSPAWFSWIKTSIFVYETKECLESLILFLDTYIKI